MGKRMIWEYEVIHEMQIGDKDIAVAVNPKAPHDEKYLCCYIQSNAIFEQYQECLASDDYVEIIKIYGERIIAEADRLQLRQSEIEKNIGDKDHILTKDQYEPITEETLLENQVVVISPDVLRPEYKNASSQLLLCTGGFGSQPNARGRCCYCTYLYDGETTTYYRHNIIGIVQENKLPAWAKIKLYQLRNQKKEELK